MDKKYFEPFKTELGGRYDRDTLHLTPLGLKEGVKTGTAIALLIGYDKEKEAQNEKSILQALPIFFYSPTEELGQVDNWDRNFIEFILRSRVVGGEGTKEKLTQGWHTAPHKSVERQFYERFVSSTRKDKTLSVRAELLTVMMTEDFFFSNKMTRLEINGRFNLLYGKQRTQAAHLADCYVIHCAFLSPYGKVVREALFPIFLGDEDTYTFYPSDTMYGKQEITVPLDSKLVQGMFSHYTSDFSKPVAVTGNINGTEVEILEQPLYQGRSIDAIEKLLENITTLKTQNGHYFEDTTSIPVKAYTKNLTGLAYRHEEENQVSLVSGVREEIIYDAYLHPPERVLVHHRIKQIPSRTSLTQIYKLFPLQFTKARNICIREEDRKYL